MFDVGYGRAAFFVDVGLVRGRLLVKPPLPLIDAFLFPGVLPKHNVGTSLLMRG